LFLLLLLLFPTNPQMSVIPSEVTCAFCKLQVEEPALSLPKGSAVAFAVDVAVVLSTIHK